MPMCNVFSDKTGDVYEFPLKGSPQRKDSTDASNEEPMSCSDEDAEPRPLLGHLSMLLDMVGFIVHNPWYCVCFERTPTLVTCFR